MKEIIIVLEKRENNVIANFLKMIIREKPQYYKDFFIEFRRRTFYSTLEKMKKLERIIMIHFGGFSIFEVNKEKVGRKKFVKFIQRKSQIDFIDENENFELWSLKNE